MWAANGIARTERPAASSVSAKSPRTAVSSSTSKTDVDAMAHDTARPRRKGSLDTRRSAPGVSGDLTILEPGPSGVPLLHPTHRHIGLVGGRVQRGRVAAELVLQASQADPQLADGDRIDLEPVSYTHLRA